MKILLIAKPWKGGLARYFDNALRAAFPAGEVVWISSRPQTMAEKIAFHRDPTLWRQRLAERINRAACDSVLFINHARELPELEPRDRNLLYLVDDARLSAAETSLYGRVFLSDPGYEADIRSVLPAAKYGGILPFAFDPSVHKPAPQKRGSGDVCFIGSWGRKREPYFAKLFHEKFNTLIVGNSFFKSASFWRHPLSFRPFVPNEAMGRIYARYRVSLNIHSEVIRRGTNMRTFECAGYGIPQVVEWREGIDAYFEPGREMLFFRDDEEMGEKIRILLRDPGLAGRMAEAARVRALAEHTYGHRIAAIYKEVLA